MGGCVLQTEWLCLQTGQQFKPEPNVQTQTEVQTKKQQQPKQKHGPDTFEIHHKSDPQILQQMIAWPGNHVWRLLGSELGVDFEGDWPKYGGHLLVNILVNQGPSSPTTSSSCKPRPSHLRRNPAADPKTQGSRTQPGPSARAPRERRPSRDDPPLCWGGATVKRHGDAGTVTPPWVHPRRRRLHGSSQGDTSLEAPLESTSPRKLPRRRRLPGSSSVNSLGLLRKRPWGGGASQQLPRKRLLRSTQ